MKTSARINQLVKTAIPKGKPFRVIWEPTGIGKWRILRVVTPAWKSLPRFERIHRMQQAVEPHLSARERAQIFRFSVLTPGEFKRLAAMLPPRQLLTSRRSYSNGRSKAGHIQ